MNTNNTNTNTNTNTTMKDFLNVDYIQTVNACLVHSAKLLDCKFDHNKNNFVRFINGENKEDIFQQAFLNALAMAESETACDMPLLLGTTIACTKAINKYYYSDSKKADDIADYENTLNVYFDNPCEKAIKDDSLYQIISFIRDDMQSNCAKLIGYIEYGYTFVECAEIMKVSPKTIYSYVSTITNALAMYYASEKDWNTAEKLIQSDKALKDSIANRQAQKAISAWKSGKAVDHESIVKWQAIRNAIESECANMTYIEKILYFANNQKRIKEQYYK